MKNIVILELEGKLQNPILEFVLEYEGFFKKEQIDAILDKGESGLQDLRLILKAYNQHHLKYLEIKNYGNVHPVSTVIAALAYLNDEDSFDDMLQYLYTSSTLIDVMWGDDLFESFPICFAKLPNKIAMIEKALYDPELILDHKSILTIGLCAMPNVLNKPELNSIIANVFLEYLRYLLAPQNRRIQEEASEDSGDMDDLIDDVISGYMDCGGNGNHPFIQQAIEDDLFVVESTYVHRDMNKWDIFVFPLRDIYTSNEFWKAKEEKNKGLNRSFQTRNHKQFDMIPVLNYTKLYSKFIAPDDLINVKYKADGKIVNEIAFREVEDDLMNDKCEII